MKIETIIETALNTYCLPVDMAAEALSYPISDYLGMGVDYPDVMKILEQAEISLGRERAHQLSFGIKTGNLDYRPGKKK
jgi:hypothetical protein